MKYLFIVAFSLISLFSSAQKSFKTGDIQLDTDLNEINARANLDFGAFKTDLSISYDISEKKIEFMHGSLSMSPGDIYVALEISKISKTPIDRVINVYKSHKEHGWGNIAKELGIKPGSPEFHQLKNNSKKMNKNNRGKGPKKGNGHRNKNR
ncbi:hypothetical protein [Plebeiibacterium sediminum]|uniref:Uncharacterized protein n=1 Tax=Plebeiibacterium sediminum TaxID=2992112 RepID=A0AAE3M243_9BACT|nr:hypothetical protein [Plebeiobacterium sediminum]MCW3785334.1 hypothetical protein [Plebeiobacterium sediminum]